MLNPKLLMAVRRTAEVQGISPQGGNSLMGESQIEEFLRSQVPECLLLLLCLYMFAGAIFLWHLKWCEQVQEEPHCV